MSLIKRMPNEKLLTANRANCLKSTGPRTARGKLAASRNAGKHYIFARVNRESMEHLGEDPAEFQLLHETLRESFRPRSGFEETIVEEMAVNRFRLMRLHRAEAGILAGQRARAEHKIRGLTPESEGGMDNLRILALGMTGSRSKERYVQILQLLNTLAEKVEKEGFTKQGLELLETVYGDGPGITGSGLIAQYKADMETERRPPEAPADADKASALESFVAALQREIDRFLVQAEVQRQVRTMPLPAPLIDSLMLVPVEDLDRIMRYEAHLERQFQIKLDQLEASRRGLSPEIAAKVAARRARGNRGHN